MVPQCFAEWTSGEGELAADANVEAAVLLHGSASVHDIVAWFEAQWCASDDIKDVIWMSATDLATAPALSGRGFTSPPTEEMTLPDSRNRFSDLRLLAYLDERQGVERAENYLARTPENITPTMVE